MQFIVAVDKQWGIGKNGQMLFHIPADLAFLSGRPWALPY